MYLVEVNYNLHLLLKVPIRHIMIKPNALNASKHGDDLQDLLLFLGREHNLAMMRPIVRPIPSSE